MPVSLAKALTAATISGFAEIQPFHGVSGVEEGRGCASLRLAETESGTEGQVGLDAQHTKTPARSAGQSLPLYCLRSSCCKHMQLVKGMRCRLLESTRLDWGLKTSPFCWQPDFPSRQPSPSCLRLERPRRKVHKPSAENQSTQMAISTVDAAAGAGMRSHSDERPLVSLGMFHIPSL